MVSKVLLVRKIIQDTLGITITPEDADTIIERIEKMQAQETEDRHCPACKALLEENSVYCDVCGTDTPK